MSNGMPDWDEWKGLTQDQRDYSLYKVLTELSRQECTRDATCSKRLIECNTHFEKLEKRKWLDRGAAIAGGAVAGLLGALGIKIGG